MAFLGFGKSDNLYFPGCYSSAFIHSKIENYKKILKKLDIDFKLHKEKDFVCCGGILDELGYEKQFRKIAKQNSEIIKEKDFKKIITNCPLCLEIFSKKYKEALPDWDIKIEFILDTILNKLKETEYVTKNYFSEQIYYYDSCYLARYSKIHDSPRQLLTLLGYKVNELPKNMEESLCCGSCSSFPEINPELANKISANFIKMLKKRSIKKLVTPDPRAYQHLKQTLEQLKITPEELEIIEISDLICDALNLKKE